MQYKYKKLIEVGPYGTIIGHKNSEENEVLTLGQIGDYTYIFADSLDGQPSELVFENIILTKSELAFLKNQRYIAQIEANTLMKVKELVKDYPDFEVDTFSTQETEAKEYMKDNTSATPFIDSLAASRGVDKEVMISKIINNSIALKSMTAPIIGRYQKIIEAV